VEIEVEGPATTPRCCGRWRKIVLRYADGCEIILDGENQLKDVPFIEGPAGKLYPGLRSTIPGLREKLKTLPDPEPQLTDFHQAVRNRRPFALNEENGHRSCTLVNLAKIAVRLGRNLRFDPERQVFIDDQQANLLINEPMRSPWEQLLDSI